MTEIYSLYLSSYSSNQSQLIDNSDKANCSWNINWDEFFHGDNYNYKKCIVKFKLVSATTTSAYLSHVNNSGYLGINIPSSNQASTSVFTVLGLIYPSDAPASLQSISGSNITNINTISSNIPTATTQSVIFQTPALLSPVTIPSGSTLGASQVSTMNLSQSATFDRLFNISTFNEQGVILNSPKGIQTLNIRFLRDSNQQLQTNVPNYNILLQFEFI